MSGSQGAAVRGDTARALDGAADGDFSYCHFATGQTGDEKDCEWERSGRFRLMETTRLTKRTPADDQPHRETIRDIGRFTSRRPRKPRTALWPTTKI